ncbi:MlaD family protein [Neorhodopirellula lusitana]|uniref:MlaD family protein n=1 Tax=Neorhodopirellula lusitana TaxID=445327 RepID=UPI00384F047F
MSELDSIPLAERSQPRRPSGKKTTVVSRMWWVAAVCLVLAIGLTWASLDSPGRTITIRFDQGHGLAPGDLIRHRGIEIGTVQEVRLLPDLAGIEVIGELQQHADRVAREGSRFWIVHPQLNFDGVSGLDTAIGAKYVRVLPGDGPGVQSTFDGMSIAPPEGAEQGGIEMVLRGEDRYGLSVGSPVTFRGIEVGRVLTSHLSPDAKHVDTTIQILSPHQHLVSQRTKFWKTSGIDIAVSLKGLEFSAQSLATVLRGGVAFATPGPYQADASTRDAIDNGTVFELHERADPAWLDSQAAINVLRYLIPPTVEVRAKWSEKQFGFTRARSSSTLGLVLQAGTGSVLVLPRDSIASRATAIDDSFAMQARLGDQFESLDTSSLPTDTAGADLTGDSSLLVRLPLDPKGIGGYRMLEVPDKRLRRPGKVEDCFVVRASQTNVSAGAESATLLEMIGAEDLVEEPGYWKSRSSTLSKDIWHGAPVLSAKDEKCIGMLIVGPGDVRIATW